MNEVEDDRGTLEENQTVGLEGVDDDGRNVGRKVVE